MTTSNNAQVLGATAIGSAGLALLGTSIETSILIGVGAFVFLFGCYLVYKFRNRLHK